MNKSLISSSCLVLILNILLVSCSSEDAKSKGGRGPGKKPTSVIPVELVMPSIGTASSFYVTTATLSANSDAKINARTSGVVREILHEEGDDVKAGQILLLLENDDQKLRLQQAKNNFSSTEREFNRLNKMKKVAAVSANAWETSNSAFLNAKTQLQLAELALSYTKIAAPFDGRVVWREVDMGAYVSQGELLFRMMSINPLLLRVHVPANRIEKVAIGQTAMLKIDSVKEKLEATVSLVSPIVDPASGTVKVTMRLDNYPVEVRPGDFTEIEMVTNSRDNALLLPSVAIIEERGKNYLYIVIDNKATRRDIEVGYVLGELTEILSGITEDDHVVFKGQRNLNEGNEVNVIDPNIPATPRAKNKRPNDPDKKKKRRPRTDS
jgi:membrane fusion protein (multidrug efflux system)